jgi:restriction endonuclease S subunit
MSEPQIFRVPVSQVEGRLDPLYYFSVNNLELTKKTKYPVKRLAEVIDMQRGRFGHRPRNDPQFYDGAYPFIQTGDVVQASLTDGQITYSQTLNELGLKTSRLFDKPVVVLTIAANIGDTAILDYPACFPDSLIGMSPKSADVTLAYINLYFKFIKEYLNNLAPQSAQKNINYQQLAPVPVVVPPIAVQEAATEVYQNALKQKAELEAQAKTLMRSVDAVLHRHLGMEPLINDVDSIEQRIFKMPLSSIEGRLDPYSNQPMMNQWFHSVRTGHHPFAPLQQLVQFKRETVDVIPDGMRYVGLENISGLDGSYIETSEKMAINSANIFEPDEILFPKLRPNLNKTHLAKTKGICSTEFHVLRTVGVSPAYLLAYLRSNAVVSVLAQLVTGNTLPRLQTEDILKLPVITPTVSIQQQIITEISNLQTQAQTFRQQARAHLEQAKQQVEAMILGAPS